MGDYQLPDGRVMGWYSSLFGEHKVQNQECVDGMDNLHDGFGHLSVSTSQDPHDGAMLQDITFYGPNPTQIREYDMHYNNPRGDSSNSEEIQNLDASSETEIKGLAEDIISKLPFHKYKSSRVSIFSRKSSQNHKQCDICKVKYKKDDIVTTLPCAHKYHQHCINTWLKDNKDCCICKVEVAIS